MSIAFTCPQCREQNSVGPEFAGRRGTCAFCGATVIVPQTSGVAELVPEPAEYTTRKSGLPWILILAASCGVLLVGGSMLAFLLMPPFIAGPMRAGPRARLGDRASCMNNLKQIDLALHSYVSTNGQFPPAATTDEKGGPPMSWRVAILPFMEQDALYRQYDPKQPWNSPKNMRPRQTNAAANFAVPAIAMPATARRAT